MFQKWDPEEPEKRPYQFALGDEPHKQGRVAEDAIHTINQWIQAHCSGC